MVPGDVFRGRVLGVVVVGPHFLQKRSALYRSSSHLLSSFCRFPLAQLSLEEGKEGGTNYFRGKGKDVYRGQNCLDRLLSICVSVVSCGEELLSTKYDRPVQGP